jgi:hypothetical protein
MSGSSSSSSNSGATDLSDDLLGDDKAIIECQVDGDLSQSVTISFNHEKKKVPLFTVTRASTDDKPSAAAIASSAGKSEDSATPTSNDKEKPQEAVVDIRASVFNNKVTATWDPSTSQFQINIKDVCWTREGETKDSSLSVDSLSKEGKISTTITIKSSADSVRCDVSSKKVIVGVRIQNCSRQVRSCTKTVFGTYYEVPDQEFFHVSKLPLGGEQSLLRKLQRPWLAGARFVTIFRVYCDDSFSHRATRTISNLLGFPMRNDHRTNQKSPTQHFIAPKQLIDWILSWPERHIEGFGRFLAMFDCLTFTYLSDVDVHLVGAGEAVKKYMVKCVRTGTVSLSSSFPPKDSDVGLVSKIDDLVLGLYKLVLKDKSPGIKDSSSGKVEAEE